MRRVYWTGLTEDKGACKYGNEPSGSKKCEEFLDYLMIFYLLK